MTNREMVKGAAKAPAGSAPAPNATPLPPMPAAEESPTPATNVEPIDSSQPNASAGRAPPSADKPGLATER